MPPYLKGGSIMVLGGRTLTDEEVHNIVIDYAVDHNLDEDKIWNSMLETWEDNYNNEFYLSEMLSQYQEGDEDYGLTHYEILFSFVASIFAKSEDEAYENAWDAFTCDHHISDARIEQVEPHEDWTKVIGLRDAQLDILLEVLDDHRYAVIDTLKDEHLGMDEQFETRQYINEVDKLIERLKEARA